jgi:hypothetical protein
VSRDTTERFDPDNYTTSQQRPAELDTELGGDCGTQTAVAELSSKSDRHSMSISSSSF